MKTSESTSKISPALVKAQKSIKHAQKDAVNGHLKNGYATLMSVIEACKEALLAEEITVIQSPGSKTLTTRLQHSSGEFIESEIELLFSKQDMQGLGSAITYARRYALSAMLNISQEDDDGNAAAKAEKKTRVVSKPAASPKDNLPF